MATRPSAAPTVQYTRPAQATPSQSEEGPHLVDRIARVEAIPVSYPEPNDFDALRSLCLVKITTADGVVKADSEDNVYAIPAIGLSVPLSEDNPKNWRFGLAAYGVTGLGVDYRDTPIDQATYPSGAPVASGEYTELQIMKFAPSLSFQLLPNLSLGLAFHVD